MTAPAVRPSVSLTRRSFAGLAGLTTLAGVAACGSGSESAAPAADSTPQGGVFPVEVTNKYGTTTVTRAPKRVVSVGYTEHDTLLALGVIPVAVTEWYGDQPYATWPWARAALGDAKPTVLDAADGIPVEKVVGLDPDLVVGTNAGMEKADYDLLAKVAPTLAQSGEYTDYFEPWSVQTTAIGTVLGLETEVKELVAGIEKSFADAAAANPAFAGKNVVFLQNAVYDGSVIAYQKGLSTDFLTSLGFDVPAVLDQYAKDGGQAYIPVERISDLDAADVLVWATEKDEDRAALEKVPGFLQLEAVKAGRSVYTGGELAAAIYFTSPLSLPYVVDKLVPMLAEVIDA